MFSAEPELAWGPALSEPGSAGAAGPADWLARLHDDDVVALVELLPHDAAIAAVFEPLRRCPSTDACAVVAAVFSRALSLATLLLDGLVRAPRGRMRLGKVMLRVCVYAGLRVCVRVCVRAFG